MHQLKKQHTKAYRAITIVLFALLGFAAATRVNAGELHEGSQTHFGTFRGIEFMRYTGRFVGETARGPFHVPYEIVAPANTADGNGTVVVEPPHFVFGASGRDQTLGQALLFNHGFSYASVGFGENGMNILDPMAGDAMIAGVAVTAKLQPPYTRDVEIIKQFSESLTSDGYAAKLLGPIERRYAYGVSQSAEALFELFFGVGAQGLFDLTVMHVPLWRPAFAQPDVLNALPENFMAQDGIGKVMFVAAEGDQIISGSRQLRAAVAGANAHPNFRLYEVAGAPHLPLRGPFIPPQELNPLDIAPVVRAVFVAGNRWSKFGNEPPRSALLGAAPADEVDPYYGRPTGIARDADGNAQGGVRFPDLQIGRAHFLASAPFEVIPGLPGLAGLWTDLSCEPVAGSKGYRARIRSHGFYVRAVARQALRLFFQGYLLPEDMRSLFRDAIHADVGKPGSCDDAP